MKKHLNNIIPLFIIVTILMIVIPLPTYMLDFMLILSITASIFILLTTMYIKEALEFPVFPSVLLITTIARIALSISSTRQILSNGGDAGKVIATFGNFVLQGNAVIGFIIFLIIVLVQFIVITKGAERISEVTARFTLDAMPGKQMSIDADLNAGTITEEQARDRREKVQREADFYGAMDGATKFVKGDAIMSLITVAINLLGGVVIGVVQGGGSFIEILETYTIATVGDGLVSQVPALLISTATSMIVTRSASKDTLGVDLSRQFKSQPMVLVVSGIVLAVFGLIPGFPKIPVFALASLLMFLGYKLLKTDNEVPIETEITHEEVEEVSEEEYYRNIENIYELIPVESIELDVGYSLIPLVNESSGGSFIDRVVLFRRQFAQDMGMVVPSVRLKDNGYLNPNEYMIKLKGNEVSRGEVLVDYYLALESGKLTGEVDGIETIEPSYGIPGKWIKREKKEIAEIYGYVVIDPLAVLINHLSETIRVHANELLTRLELNQLLDNVKKRNADLVNEVVPGIITYGNLQKVLGNLLKEGVSIRDMETILETISTHGATIRDTESLTEQVRQSLKRGITHKWSKDGQIKVITVSTEVETMLVNQLQEGKGNMGVDPELVQKIAEKLFEVMNNIKEGSPILLTSPFVRGYFRKLLDEFYPQVTVLSFSEIENNIQIQVLDTVEI